MGSTLVFGPRFFFYAQKDVFLEFLLNINQHQLHVNWNQIQISPDGIKNEPLKNGYQLIEISLSYLNAWFSFSFPRSFSDFEVLNVAVFVPPWLVLLSLCSIFLRYILVVVVAVVSNYFFYSLMNTGKLQFVE